MKLDFANAWFRGPTVWLLGVFLVAATMVYMRIEKLEESVDEMRGDLRQLVNANLSQREFDAWLKLFKAMNVTLAVPDAPR